MCWACSCCCCSVCCLALTWGVGRDAHTVHPVVLCEHWTNMDKHNQFVRQRGNWVQVYTRGVEIGAVCVGSMQLAEGVFQVPQTDWLVVPVIRNSLCQPSSVPGIGMTNLVRSLSIQNLNTVANMDPIGVHRTQNVLFSLSASLVSQCCHLCAGSCQAE